SASARGRILKPLTGAPSFQLPLQAQQRIEGIGKSRNHGNTSHGSKLPARTVKLRSAGIHLFLPIGTFKGECQELVSQEALASRQFRVLRQSTQPCSSSHYLVVCRSSEASMERSPGTSASASSRMEALTNAPYTPPGAPPSALHVVPPPRAGRHPLSLASAASQRGVLPGLG